MSDVKYIVTVSSEGATKAIESLDQAWEKLGKTNATTKAETESFGQEFTKHLIPAFTVAQLAADVVRKGFGFIKDIVADSVRQAADYEKAVRGLDAAFTLSGRTMPGMTANLKKYAGEMEKLGLAEDDAILRAQSLLLQFTHLDEDGMKAATRGAIGLASVFGMDLKSAAEAVKNGTEGNYRSLGMLIPEIRNATTEEGKRAAMMKSFEDLYKRAIEDTKTYAGQVKTLGLEWKNAKQELGETILETGVLQEVMAGLTVTIKQLTGASKREYQEALGTWVESNNQAGASLKEMAERLGWNARDVALLRVQYDLSSTQLVEWVKQNMFGTEAAKTLAAVLAETEASLKKSKQGFNETGTEAAALAVDIQTLADRYAELNDDLRMLRMLGSIDASASLVASFGTLGDMVGGTLGKLIDFKDAVPGLFDGVARGMEVVKDQFDGFQGYAVTAGAALSVLDDVVEQGAANRMIALDREYQKRRDIINKTIKDEDRRQQALAELEDEFVEKRKKAGTAAWLTGKAVAISNAIISTHEAAAKALAQGGFILGIPWSAIISALGYIQVAAIAAQPIPLAKGGYFDRPTLMSGRDGRDYVGGEAGPEIMSPVPVMRQIVREETREVSRPAAAIVINILSPLISTHGLADSELEAAAPKLLDHVESELRRYGVPEGTLRRLR